MNQASSVLDKVQVFSDKISGNIIVKSISRGVMGVLPLIIVGSFANVLLGIPVAAWSAMLQATGLNQALNMLVKASSGLLGVYVAYSVAKVYAQESGVKEKMIGVFAIMFYMILLPFKSLESTDAFFNYLGSQGMLLGIVIGMLTVAIYKFVKDRNIVIKMPEGTPDYVSNSFAALIPVVVIALVAFLINFAFSFTPWQSVNDCFYGLLQAPLTNIIGGSIWWMIAVSILGQLVSSLGIHAGFMASLMAPFLFALDGANQAAYAAGQALPNSIGMAFSYSVTSAVFCPAFAIAALFVAKSKQLRTVGKISLAPSIFAISEPITFGFPVVFNPLLIIPWTIIPCVNLVIAYTLIQIGIVPAYAGVIVFNVPLAVTGILNGSVRIAIMEAALLVLDVVLSIPFVKQQDKKLLREEQEKEEQE